MSGERQGWQTWERFQEAGIVDKHVNFTDNDVVTAHALGKTGQIIGKCWPMDAAVAYTLAAAGPNAQLTSRDMINQYTKMASVMMSQKVAYGRVPDPNAFTCGHDEITGYNVTLYKTELVDGVITFTDIVDKRHKLRVKTLPSWNDIHDPSMREQRDSIEAEHGVTLWSCNHTSWYTSTKTMGECIASDEVCNHHNISSGYFVIEGDNEGLLTTWAMVKDSNDKFIQLWSREKGEAAVHDGWNNNGINIELKYTPPTRITLWSNVSRTLSNTVDTKLVLKQINASLRRMTARNYNIVSKTGERNTATYCWKEWAWLTSMQSEIANTSKKNRKANDIVNGWKYTKYASRKSFGHEVAKFKWLPADELDTTTYRLRVGGSYYSATVLPFRFLTKAEAIQFKAYIPMMATKCGANSTKIHWDASKGEAIVHDDDVFTLDNEHHDIEMTLEKDPEDLLSPTECIKHICFGSPQEYKKAKEQLEHFDCPTMQVINKPVETTQESE